MSHEVSVGDAVAAFLEANGVPVAFGVISIHNMPILDAIARRGNLRFVPARGEAGAVNMADAATRVSGRPCVAFTSTGTAAGNAAGALVEAQTAGTPMLHITGQIERPYLDRNHGYIHEARDQLGMLGAISKAAYRADAPDQVVPTLQRALETALTAPTGPVSVEIPIDVQKAAFVNGAAPPVAVAGEVQTDIRAVDELAGKVAASSRPLLWLGRGAAGAREAVLRLADMGFGIVTSTFGRGIVPEDHPACIGAFGASPAVEDLFKSSDLLLVVGSRLRGNETLKYSLSLPSPRYRIDADPAAFGHPYAMDGDIVGDAAAALTRLADALDGRMAVDPGFAADIARARDGAIAALHEDLGVYSALLDAVEDTFDGETSWVRDVTVSNSMWGNRRPALSDTRQGIHALGGGIGQGLAMGIGAALAGTGRKALCLVGDGGFQLNIGELATAAQEQADMVILLMNSGGYQVIRNIQDAEYGSRHPYVDLLTPDFAAICGAVGVGHRMVSDLANAGTVLREAMQQSGPVVVEFDMAACGDFARAFAGPPVRKAV